MSIVHHIARRYADRGESLALFEMEEPADATLAAHDPINLPTPSSISDSRRGFITGDTMAAGYVRDRAEE